MKTHRKKAERTLTSNHKVWVPPKKKEGLIKKVSYIYTKEYYTAQRRNTYPS